MASVPDPSDALEALMPRDLSASERKQLGAPLKRLIANLEEGRDA